MPSINSAISSSSLAVVIDKELEITIFSIYISSGDLTKAVDPALLLCAISFKMLN